MADPLFDQFWASYPRKVFGVTPGARVECGWLNGKAGFCPPEPGHGYQRTGHEQLI